MAEATGRNRAEPELSGVAQGAAHPNLLKSKAPLVQAVEVGAIDAEAGRTEETEISTGTSAEVVLGEEAANEKLRDSTRIPGSRSNTTPARAGAPPTETLPGEGVGSSVLAQQAHHPDLGTMATAASPEPAAAQAPIAHEGDEVEVDADYLNDNDSALGDEHSSYSTSLASSVRANYYEHGRRYSAYKDSGYIRPNDETEVDRLDMLHHIFKLLANGKLYEAPIPEGVQRVLDIGCGTGIWAIDFADEHPSAEVLGVDLTPIQPEFVPPNCKFEIDDIEEDFTYRRPFDFIHCRYMAYAIKDWPRLMSQIYQHTAPGGFVEFTDFDLVIRSDDGSLDNTTLKTWTDTLPKAGRMLGREPCPGPFLEQWVRDAGFTNITTKIYKLPIGPWPKNPDMKLVGAYYHVTVSQGVEGFSLRLYMNVLKWSYEELQVLLAKVRKDLNTRSIHSYTAMYKVIAQRPGLDETLG